jgi:protoporphyrinogen oxidase
MIKTDILIIGGGVTGLSLASFLNSKDYLVIEKEQSLGGYCKTTIKGDYVWDYSGHFFHFRNEEIKNYILSEVDCELLKVEKITDIDYKGQIIDFPFQHNISQLNEDEYQECLEDLKNCKYEDKTTFKSYVRSTLGNGICDKFIIPYNEKLYACDLNKLEFDSMGRFFPKRSESNNNVSYNDTFIYPIKGSYEYIRSILKRVDETKIQLNTEVIDIDLVNKIVKTNKGDIKFNKLISTLPFDKLLQITKQESNLSSNKVAVFNLGFDKGSDIKTHWRYYPNDEVFYRVGFYNNILSQEKLSLYVEIGLNQDDKVDQKDLLDKVLCDLKKVKVITDHKLVDHQFLLMNPAYVHITHQSKKIYQDWCDKYNPQGVFSIGRYGEWTYCSIEDNIIKSKEISNYL